jgi:hypothetical protein
MKPRHGFALTLVVLVATGGMVRANDVREYSLEKKARLADVVIIGRVMSVRREGGGPLEYALVHVDKALKGEPPNSVEVLVKGAIAEMDPECCVTGGVYLWFLVKEKDKRFESVNGRFGIYLIHTP